MARQCSASAGSWGCPGCCCTHNSDPCGRDGAQNVPVVPAREGGTAPACRGRCSHPLLCPLQIGSYYGSEINSLDVNGDGVTDVLLVGAPMYFSEGRERGKVYVYTLREVRGSGASWGMPQGLGCLGAITGTVSPHVTSLGWLRAVRTRQLPSNTPGHGVPVQRQQNLAAPRCCGCCETRGGFVCLPYL